MNPLYSRYTNAIKNNPSIIIASLVIFFIAYPMKNPIIPPMAICDVSNAEMPNGSIMKIKINLFTFIVYSITRMNVINWFKMLMIYLNVM